MSTPEPNPSVMQPPPPHRPPVPPTPAPPGPPHRQPRAHLKFPYSVSVSGPVPTSGNFERADEAIEYLRRSFHAFEDNAIRSGSLTPATAAISVTPTEETPPQRVPPPQPPPHA